MFGSRQQSFKKNRLFRGSNNVVVGRDKRRNEERITTTTSSATIGRLSPLKENIASQPKPIVGGSLASAGSNTSNSSSRSRNERRRNHNIIGTNRSSSAVVNHTSSTNHTNHNSTNTRQCPSSNVVVNSQNKNIVSSSSSALTGFSQAELQELQESFQLFDMDNTGTIMVGELRNILETLKHEQQDELYQYPHLNKLLFTLSDYDKEDLLSLDDYVELMASTTISNALLASQKNHDNVEEENNDDDDDEQQQERNAHHHQRNYFAHVFQLFDTDGKGYITLQDLERVALELGEHDMTYEELEDMMERAMSSSKSLSLTQNAAVSKQDLRVGLDEFTRIMTMKLYPHKAEQS